MSSRVLLVSAILATTAALGASAAPRDKAAPPVTEAREQLGEHPAVLVAREWKTRGIDPNTFIVGHPALAR